MIRACFDCGIFVELMNEPVEQRLPCDNPDHKHYTYYKTRNPKPDKLERAWPVDKNGEPVDKPFHQLENASDLEVVL